MPKWRSKALFIMTTIFAFIHISSYHFAYCDDSEKQIGYENIFSLKNYSLTIHGNLLTLRSAGASLRHILNDISSKTGVAIKSPHPFDKKVTIHFNELTLEEALGRLAPNHALVFLKTGGQKGYRLTEAVLTKGVRKAAASQNDDHQADADRQSDHSSKAKTGLDNQSAFHSQESHKIKTNKLVVENHAYVPNELVVRFKSGLTRQEIDRINSPLGIGVKKCIEPINYYILTLPTDVSVPDAISYFHARAVTVSLEPNYLIPINAVPDDTHFSQQWSLQNTGQNGGMTGADIDAVDAWGVEQGDLEVIIAIVDTGVDYTHEELSGKIWTNPGEIPDNGLDDDNNGYVDDTIGWDFVDASGGASGEDFIDPDNDPMDRHGHGTHVAGIAAAAAYNGIGIAGVAPNCTIMPVRAGYKTSSGNGVLESVDAAQAIVYASENGAKVINLSWGDYQKSNLIEDAMTFATDRGALVCAAAGNENSSGFVYPAASDNIAVVSVGATTNQDRKATYSNYGDWVDVSAPGDDIFSTYPGNGYYLMSGTSMATPHVAGLAALLFSHFPELSPIEAKTKIMRSVNVVSDLYEKNATSGRVNAFDALTISYETPHIFSINHDEVHCEDQITIVGDSFGEFQEDGYVTFTPGITADIISWNDSVIVCETPANAISGAITVSTSKGTSNGIEITVLKKYYDQDLIDNEYTGGGDAQGWKADDRSWTYVLPFDFQFFGKQYSSVNVCSNGFLDFTKNTSPYLNSKESFKSRVMIAPLWDDLITNGSSQENEDIYIHYPSSDSVSFHWIGERYETGDPVNFEVTLYKDGRVKFNYGSGNANLSPTIGLSGSDEGQYHLAEYNESSQLDKVQSVLFTPLNQSYIITLNSGWNLISIPLAADNNQVSQIMGPVVNGIESIWGITDNEWQVYIPSDPETSNLEIMKPGYGYWINAKQDNLEIQVQGKISTTPIDVSSSWNLIGVRSLFSQPVLDVISDFDGECEVIWGYNNGEWKLYDSKNKEFSDLDELNPGMGYWIKFMPKIY